MASCSTELAPASEALDLARRHVEAVLDGHRCHIDTVVTAQLLVAKLVADVLRPTGPAVVLTVRVDGRDLLIEVEDLSLGLAVGTFAEMQNERPIGRRELKALRHITAEF